MFCQKCGAPAEENQKFCNKCGNNLVVSQSSSQNTNKSTYNKKTKKNMIFIGLGIGLGVLIIVIACIFAFGEFDDNDYYSTDTYETYDDEEKKEEKKNDKEIGKGKEETKPKKGKYRTVIITDNRYFGVEINDDSDAYELIVEDSVNQKDTTSEEIKAIEDEIINKYGVTAVNLCEMDVEFAQEIENVLGKIYDKYPSIRGNITNLALVNGTMSENYIAVFMPVFHFAESDSKSTYPWVMKTQILLNTTYFLNTERLEVSVTDGSSSGHFPPNATRYSPVAHEFGHYLSFLALLNNYNVDSILLIDDNNLNDFNKIYTDFANGDFTLKMINEAYENYKRDIGTDLTIDEWRATISNYAVAKDNSGNYIYDETIAEAFHDVYLNEENAKDASKYIVSVLEKYLES